jgi:hypothetical protein
MGKGPNQATEFDTAAMDRAAEQQSSRAAVAIHHLTTAANIVARAMNPISTLDSQPRTRVWRDTQGRVVLASSTHN